MTTPAYAGPEGPLRGLRHSGLTPQPLFFPSSFMQLSSVNKWGVTSVNKVLERLGGLAHVHAANRLLRLMVAMGRWVRVYTCVFIVVATASRLLRVIVTLGKWLRGCPYMLAACDMHACTVSRLLSLMVAASWWSKMSIFVKGLECSYALVGCCWRVWGQAVPREMVGVPRSLPPHAGPGPAEHSTADESSLKQIWGHGLRDTSPCRGELLCYAFRVSPHACHGAA